MTKAAQLAQLVQGPAFSAYQSTSQATIAANTYTKVSLQTEEFDTANAFDNVTNFRFTPLVAGYYQVNGNVQGNSNAGMLATIYKNGTYYKRGQYPSGATMYGASVSSIVYLNGSTDYIELYVYSAGTTNTLVNDSAITFFNAALVRPA